MGNTFRKGEGAAPSQPQQRSKAEEHLHQAVVRYSQSSTRKPIKNLNRILLKLGDVGRAFNDCRKWFDEGDIDKDQTLSLTETKALLRRLGITLPDEEIQEIFASTDTDHNKRLSFKEFVTLLALTALLQEQSTQTVFSEQSQVALTDALSAIHVAVECFLLFDINHDGEISKEEIGKMMVSHSVAHEKEIGRGLKTDKNESAELKEVTMARLKEMDLDLDGHVTFTEFLIGFSSWADVEDDEDE